MTSRAVTLCNNADMFTMLILSIGTLQRFHYKMLRGFAPLDDWIDTYYPFPPDIPQNHFPLFGDPVRRKGFVDGLGESYSLAPGERRIMLTCSPFTLAPGDTQEVVFAGLAAIRAGAAGGI
jgi:hypothetical protein